MRWCKNISTVISTMAIGQSFDAQVPTYFLRQAVQIGAQGGQLFPSEVAAWNERLERRRGWPPARSDLVI